MKRKSIAFKLIAFLVVIVVLAMIVLIPPVTNKVAGWTGTAASKVKYIAQTIVGAGVGLLLVSFGVAALSAPIVGICLILAGVALAAYSLWPLFRPNMSVSTNNLNNMGNG